MKLLTRQVYSFLLQKLHNLVIWTGFEENVYLSQFYNQENE